MHRGRLHSCFLASGEKRVHKWVHYFDIYERHFARFCGTEPRVLEIGVHGGGSLAMWREYFGPGALITGLDIKPGCARWADERIAVVIGSQDDDAVLDALCEEHGPFDIVIDDGSHVMAHQIHSFERLYGRMSPVGVYLAEDTQTSYQDRYGGGLRREGSFIEFTKAKIDELHAARIEGQVATEFTASTAGIAVYDGIVVFERRPQGKRRSLIMESMLAPEIERRQRRRQRFADAPPPPGTEDSG